jgi:dynein heavy chain
VWAYLESIFVGSEDIRKQLPHETKMFEGVNDMFISNMATMHASFSYPFKFSPSLFL